MERNTVLAVVLSTLVLVVFYVIQTQLNPPVPPNDAQYQPPIPAPTAAPVDDPTPGVITGIIQERPVQTVSSVEETSGGSFQETTSSSLEDSGPQAFEFVTIKTGLTTVTLTNEGGNIVSWILNEHFDRDRNVDMIFSGTNEARAFSIAFGGLDAQPVSSLFYVNRLSDHSVEFYRDFSIPAASAMAAQDGIFRLTKRYDFKPGDYMFELTITLDGGFSVHGFNFAGNAYTISFGPQIGPRFEKLDQRNDYRQYFTYANGKRRNAKVNDIIDTRPAWAAIAGKYFAFIAIPYLVQYNVSFSEASEPGLPVASRFYITRPAVNSSKFIDTYRFYLGPKAQEALVIYNTGKNEFGLTNTELVEIASTRGVLAPLERALKWMLMVFYRIVPNYGVAIILLTLFIKVIFFPLTKKGSEGTLKMQALAPKIKEIQEKYKNNPQKLQAETQNFYKQEGYNPISGCLPMLLQLPIFIAMYNLFNNHFDLRGAMFIPGWIPDLSVPEYIIEFPDGFRLPLLGWSALRLLPFIYVGSQLIYGKVTQMPGQQSNTQMKMMLYVMPIAFFFILYNMPSGLLVYWIMSNILTLVQQVIINRYLIAKKTKNTQDEVQPVKIPPVKKKRR